MSQEEFLKNRFIQVRRNNINYLNNTGMVYRVKGVDQLEGLILIDEPKYFGGESWVRYENVDIITKLN
jgi:hypothetical protein